MKRIGLLVLSLALVLVLFGCNNAGSESVKTVDNSEAAIYSMDLSDIPGYESHVVTDGTWAETYDVIIGLSRLETDAVKRTALYHAAEDLLMFTGMIVPLYYYTDLFMAATGVEGVFTTPTSIKIFKFSTLDDVGTNMNICLASEPDTIDPALNSSVDGATYVTHAFSALMGYNADNELVADLAASVPTPTENGDGTVTYVFELRAGLKWSDGSALTAADFEYSWRRAAAEETASDYGYLFSIVDGYEDGDLNIDAVDATHFSVTLNVDVPYFLELISNPTFMPVKESIVEADPDGWATDPATYISNGAYYLYSWDHNSNLVFKKNPEYWNADAIVMEQLTFYLSDDDIAILSNFKSGSYDFIDNVPNDEIADLKVNYADEFFIAGQLGTYYVIFNNNKDLIPSKVSADMTDVEKLIANQDIRKALSLLLDRNYIVEEIGQAGQLPASSYVAMGITNADGSQFYESAGHNAGYIGYYNTAASAYAANCAEAVEILKLYFEYDEATGKFTNFTTFDYLFNTSTGHQAIAEYIQAAFENYGIIMTLNSQEWGTFLNTRKNGDYTFARNGWLGDFNDAITFLDMWTTDSGNNDAQFGK